MKSAFYHLQLNIDFDKNKSFYKDLMELLGWEIIFEGDNIVGYRSGKNGDLWFSDSLIKENQNYDKLGFNHLAIRVEQQSDIDDMVEYMKSKNIQALFNTPAHRPEFTSEEDETYYQVMFESPDKILFEIVYIGPKE